MGEFLAGVAIGIIALGAVGVAAFFVLRQLFERASHRVANDIGHALAELSARTVSPGGPRSRVPRTPADGVTHLGAYAAARGLSEDAARREFVDTIERIARLMDGAVRVPIIGPIGLDAALGLFPFAGDTISAAISVWIISLSLKYGVPRDIIARMLANVLVDFLMGAVPVVGDMADIWFRANIRNVQLLREYLAESARDTIDVTPVRPSTA